jgi:hypothetical protein
MSGLPDSATAFTTSPRNLPNKSAFRHVETGLNNAVVTKCDTCAANGSEQAALPDGNDLLAATGKNAHDRHSAVDIGATATTMPPLIRPSTIEGPSVRALKLQKPSKTRCSSSQIGVSRTRLASAKRTASGTTQSAMRGNFSILRTSKVADDERVAQRSICSGRHGPKTSTRLSPASHLSPPNWLDGAGSDGDLADGGADKHRGDHVEVESNPQCKS